MRVAVCVKRVPKTDARIRPAADGRGIDLSGVPHAMSPYDEFAVEEALRQRDKAGGGEVVVVTLGPGDARSVLRDALAMGADRGVLLLDEAAARRDPFSTADALAPVLKEIAADLLLFGKQAVDDDAGLVPTLVCEALGIPCVCVVTKVEISGREATAHRQVEGGIEIVRVPLPCGITCQKGLNEPRYASLPNIMKAKQKPLAERPAPVAPNRTEILSIAPPAPRPKGRLVGRGAEAVPALLRLLHEEAKVL